MIKFENVSFHYFDDDKLILKDFNFEIKNGESVAFIGSTGSGKSTIVNLICKFYNPTSGGIYLDGINYRNIDKTCLYNNLGYVLQQPQLFSISIKENIKFGNENATDEEILKVCNLLGIDEFISKLPNGKDTVIGETGYNISGGQKQRIAIARAIITKPSLLLADEPTGALDSTSSEMILNLFRQVNEDGQTVLVVTHSLRAASYAKRVLFIKDGIVFHEIYRGENEAQGDFMERISQAEFMLGRGKKL